MNKQLQTTNKKQETHYSTLPGAHDVGRARNGARTTTASVAAPQPVKASRAIKEMPVGR